MRQCINILNMEHLGMIRLELHVSFQKELKPRTPNNKNFLLWKYSWSQLTNQTVESFTFSLPYSIIGMY